MQQTHWQKTNFSLQLYRWTACCSNDFDDVQSQHFIHYPAGLVASAHRHIHPLSYTYSYILNPDIQKSYMKTSINNVLVMNESFTWQTFYSAPSFLVCLMINQTAARISDRQSTSVRFTMSHFTLQTQSRILQWWRLDFCVSVVHKRWTWSHCLNSRDVTVIQSSNPNLYLKVQPFIESQKALTRALDG